MPVSLRPPIRWQADQRSTSGATPPGGKASMPCSEKRRKTSRIGPFRAQTARSRVGDDGTGGGRVRSSRPAPAQAPGQPAMSPEMRSWIPVFLDRPLARPRAKPTPSSRGHSAFETMVAVLHVDRTVNGGRPKDRGFNDPRLPPTSASGDVTTGGASTYQCATRAETALIAIAAGTNP